MSREDSVERSVGQFSSEKHRRKQVLRSETTHTHTTQHTHSPTHTHTHTH